MKKIELGPKPFLPALPTVIIGANVEGKPNYMTIAWTGILSWKPPLIYFAAGGKKRTTSGIEETGTFSVNVPSTEMVMLTDYVGTYSGSKVDKSTLFNTFYGKLETAPMITDCPLNLECTLIDTPPYGASIIFIGEVAEAYIGEDYITENLPDISKLAPLIYATGVRTYHKVGDLVAKAFTIGKEFKPITE